MGSETAGSSVKPPKLTVGVLIDSVENYFNRRAIQDILSAAGEQNVRIVIFPCGPMKGESIVDPCKSVLSIISPETIDALIMFPHSIAPLNPDTLGAEVLKSLGDIPGYTIFANIPGYFGITPDEEGAIGEMIDHLAADHGFSRFALLLGHDSPDSVSKSRQNAIQARLKDRGISITEDRIFPGAFTLEDGKKAASAILSKPDDMPEVLICMNDQMAIGAVREFVDRGLSIPGNMAVVGFDDIEETNALPCPFTTINLPVWDISSALIKRIASDASGETTYQALHQTIPAEFMHRESCGCSSWLDKKLPTQVSFKPLETRRASLITLKRAANLRRSLDDILDKALEHADETIFTAFVNDAFLELSRSGDLASSFIDTFSTQWTIALLKHRDLERQIFINTLFVDALRQLMQIKALLFSEANERTEAALAFYREGSELLAKNQNMREALAGIASNLPRLGVKRALLAFLDPEDPTKARIRMLLQAGASPDIPAANSNAKPLPALIARDAIKHGGSLAILPIAKADRVFGFLVLSITERRVDHFGLIQQIVSKVIASVMEQEKIATRLTSLAQTNEDLSKLSTLDAATGLSNRRALHQNGRDMYESACTSGQSSCFIFFDMDDLKKINDAHGHPEGDKAILAFARILQTCFRGNDLVVRYGGDEFVVLMTNITEHSMRRALDRITNRLAEYNERGGNPWVLSASWGHVFTNPKENPRTFESIIEESDSALYDQKRKRKDR